MNVGHLSIVWYRSRMSGTYRLVMGDRGRVVIPAVVRERHGMVAGAPLTLLDTPEGLVLMTREQVMSKVREDLQGLDLVGELLRERRAEADWEGGVCSSSTPRRSYGSCSARMVATWWRRPCLPARTAL